MSGLGRAFLLLVAVVVVIGIAALAGGYRWNRVHAPRIADATAAARHEGEQFGEESDDRACLEEVLARHRSAPGAEAAPAQGMFLKGCLSTSEPAQGFCDGVPRSAAADSALWQAKRCVEAGFADLFCRQILRHVQRYCESALAPPKQRARGTTASR